MTPGRELDAKIADKVMGLPDVHTDYIGEWTYRKDEFESQCSIRIPLPSYSTDISAAWEVMEKVWPNGVAVMRINGEWACSGENEKHGPPAETAPHAICLAALKAVGAELAKEERKGVAPEMA